MTTTMQRVSNPRMGIGPPATMAELRWRIEDCAMTMRRLPPSRASAGPQGFRSNMPAYIHDNVAESYGYQRLSLGRIVPTAAEIGRMDEVFGWITRWWSHAELRASGLPIDAGIVAFERAGLRYPIPRIRENRIARWPGQAPPGGVSAPSIRRLEEKALGLMLRALGGDPTAQEPKGVQRPSRAVLDVVLDFTQQERIKMVAGAPQGFVSHVRAEHRLVRLRPKEEE